jgi:phytoene synthase
VNAAIHPDTVQTLLDESHGWCHRQTQQHARSFYFASIALPREKKQAAYAVYSFCRYADDLVDRAVSTDGVDAALARIGAEFDHMIFSPSRGEPFAPAFGWAVRRYGIEKQFFLDLLKGVAMDLGPVRIADWPQLRDYCYHVASVVGLMMSRIFELRDESGLERAIDLGIAMQLTNIIRDVGEDFCMGRIYLPADEMAAHGVALGDLSKPRASDNLKALLHSQIIRAREFYLRAEAGIPLLANDGSQLTVWLMRHVYAGILDEVERIDYEVLQRRAKTSFSRKLALAARAWRDHRRLRPS